MAIIINASINLNEIPKEKIINGKKGKYLPLTIVINDEPDKFDNDGPVFVAQDKDERTNKAAKKYLGNAKVVWTNGSVPEPSFSSSGQQSGRSKPQQEEDDDLPF